MNANTINRIREAAKYQKMAMKALLPPNAAAHLDVIENELQQMLQEFITGAEKENEEETEKKAGKKVKKVSIQ